jgi:hypothetical protein
MRSCSGAVRVTGRATCTALAASVAGAAGCWSSRQAVAAGAADTVEAVGTGAAGTGVAAGEVVTGDAAGQQA